MAKKNALEEAMKKATAAIERRNAQPIEANNDIVQNRLNAAMNQATQAIKARAAKEQTTARMQTAPNVVAPTQKTAKFVTDPATQKSATSQVWDAVPQVKQEETKQNTVE